MKFVIGFLLSILLISSCSQETDEVIASGDILALGHTYRWGDEYYKVDKKLEHIDYNQFNELFLLGDICSVTDKDESTFQYLDSLFKISDSNTKWAIGNHDIRTGNLEYFAKYTHRDFHYSDLDSFHASYVLNTQILLEAFKDSCDYFDRQHVHFTSFLEDLLHNKNTSVNSLFVLSHNPVWADSEPSLRDYELIGNTPAGWVDLICDQRGEFQNLFFPLLEAIQAQGIQVHCVAGDGGQYDKAFYHEGESGIKYYVTGINNSVIDTGDEETIQRFNTDPDSVLIFRHDKKSHSYTGEFIPLDNL